MFLRIKNIFSNQLYFFVGYALFLVFFGIVLYSFDKKTSSFWINQHWNIQLDLFFKYITHLGDGWSAFVVAVLLILFSPKLKYGIYAIGSFMITAILTQLCKRVFFSDSMRPAHEYFSEFSSGQWHRVDGVELLTTNSFPSGHATSAFSIFCLLTLISKNKSLGIIFIVFASLAAFSRVYLSLHFIEDIYVGSLIGCVGTIIVFIFLDSLKWRSAFEQPLFKRN